VISGDLTARAVHQPGLRRRLGADLALRSVSGPAVGRFIVADDRERLRRETGMDCGGMARNPGNGISNISARTVNPLDLAVRSRSRMKKATFRLLVGVATDISQR